MFRKLKKATKAWYLVNRDRSFRNVWEHEEWDTKFGVCLSHRLSENGFGENKHKSGTHRHLIIWPRKGSFIAWNANKTHLKNDGRLLKLHMCTQGEKDFRLSIKYLAQLWHTQRCSRRQWKLSLCIRRLGLSSIPLPRNSYIAGF